MWKSEEVPKKHKQQGRDVFCLVLLKKSKLEWTHAKEKPIY